MLNVRLCQNKDWLSYTGTEFAGKLGVICMCACHTNIMCACHTNIILFAFRLRSHVHPTAVRPFCQIGKWEFWGSWPKCPLWLLWQLLQHFGYSLKNKRYIKRIIYEHVSLRFHQLAWLRP